ncbi:aminomethyltransferase [Streptosporangium album]|uniref:Aminomethyltransferase n=1 Tax=Streptosporangium album TaxID=47479 RepID=A0A7W7RY42_9ACTN|nr:glycine cleavage system aminomethyltransferase GcvT [Streptosporangium album]MBB4940280.1 aminomethyltransferase [Streptosporangium album]
MSRPTPLRDVHEALGATLTDFAGWLMPLRYGSESTEHNAVRQAAGLFDLSHMGEIFVTGPQAGEALDYALVGYISALEPGRARYTMIVDPAGGVLDDLIVYRLADDEFMVVANASNYPRVAAELAERATAFDAVVEDRSEQYALIAVQGPRSRAILGELTDADLGGLKYYAGLPATVAGRDALVARTGYTGEDGFELFIAAGDAEPLWAALTEAGEPYGLRPAGLSARDTLRLEAGMPLYGNELSADLTPFDAGLGRVVRFDKPGDFVGRAALEPLKDVPPARRLVGLVTTGRRVPRHGYPVVVAGDGAVAGVVTSGAPSASLGKPIAMAYVDSGLSDGLAVDIRGNHEPVDIVELPFYRRKK